jgi:octaprenyl-diphosphate synthase
MDLALRTGNASILSLAVETLIQLVEGQMMELQNQGNLTLTERASIQIIEKKTASLFAMACKLGGLLGRGTPEQVLALESFGLQLGVAFQLLDDIQDYLSGQTRTGKEPGRDLAEEKITLPVLVAFRQAGTKDKKKIRRIFSDPQRARGLRELTALVEDHGGFSYTLREAEECVEKAVSALHLVPASEERTDLEQAAWEMLRENTPIECIETSSSRPRQGGSV